MILLEFVAQALAVAGILLEEQQWIVGETPEYRMALLGHESSPRIGARPSCF